MTLFDLPAQFFFMIFAQQFKILGCLKCGVSKVQRIVGGEDSDKERVRKAFSYLIFLFSFFNFFFKLLTVHKSLLMTKLKNEYPWMTFMFVRYLNWFLGCGGSILNSRYILKFCIKLF